MTRCDRCHDETNATIMSKFNTDILCMECKADEKLCPGYKAADEAEVRAVREGVKNYPGYGLSPIDRAVLAGRLQKRADKKAHQEQRRP